MSTHSHDTVQSGKTEFWEEVRDSRLEERHDVSESRKLWRPIDYMLRTRRLHRLDKFIVRATTIIDESREVDRIIEERKQQPHGHPASEITETPQSISRISNTLKQPEVA